MTSNASSVTSANIDLNGTFDLANSANSLNARANLDIAGNKMSVVFDETSSKDGDTYIKIRGLDGLKGGIIDEDETNCIDGGPDTNCTATTSDDTLGLDIYGQLFGAIDNQWILLSGGVEDTLSDFQITADNSLACTVEAFTTTPGWAKEVAQKMEKNQFISYSSEKLEIQKKKNPLFRLTVDKSKVGAFVKSLDGLKITDALKDCAGDVEDEDSTLDGIKAMLESLPTMYVEVDESYNFTRLYVKTANDGNTSTIDLNLTYPGKFEFNEPDEYTDITTIMQNLVTSIVTE
jgi:hypothetical protein